jgi:tetratricopeptide (TPR) repeat protein
MPSKWELEKELGKVFVSIGVIRSALEIFERLEMWDDVISCHQMLEQSKKAEIVILDLLEKSPSPKLYCLLGDVRNDTSLYTKAWEFSNSRYARAMRSLGADHFRNEQWQKCIECYGLALAINPLFENSWFVMGCAALRIEDYETAIKAFARVTAIDPDNGEAWNNLASVYIKQKKLIEAFRCLKEAIRPNYDASNIWEN